MSDQLHINGIRAYGYTGALPEENVLGQWFQVDLTLWLDLSVAGASDVLADTHNYVDLVQGVQTLIQTETFQLIERMADAIATQSLSSDPRIQQIRVQLTKPNPPIPNFDGQVVVDITRQCSEPISF
ncbi:MAG: dihydroneopterin aldolase [Cyanobacteria bacterium J06632_22]